MLSHLLIPGTCLILPAGLSAAPDLKTDNGDSLSESARRAAAPEAVVPAPDPVEPESSATKESGGLSGLLGKAGEIAKKSGLADFSWEDIDAVPYEDKAQLIAWAVKELQPLQEKLLDAAELKGRNALANLGDSGWQGALKQAMQAVDGLREASPQTWDSATRTLQKAWSVLQVQASRFLGNS